jgi:hypothetical protein
MTGKKPNYRAIVKTGEKRWANIGAGWTNNDKVSVQLDQTPIPSNGKMRFLLVPNTQRKSAATAVTA